MFKVGILFIFLMGCGVKGKPVAPTDEPEISRGEPNFSKAAKGIRIDQKKKKDDKDDWDKAKDFETEEGE